MARSVRKPLVIEDIAVPMAEAPDIISVPETTTTPESETTPVLAAPVDIEAVPAIQDAPETAASVEPEQAATVKEPEVVEETGDEFEEQEKEDKALALYTKKTLTFKEDGDIALVEEAGEDPEFMAICMMTIGASGSPRATSACTIPPRITWARPSPCTRMRQGIR